MKKIMMANLKMNLNYDDMKNYKQVLESSGVEGLIICPSYLFLSDMKSDKYDLCSQNGYAIDKGAFTGEISFYQLSSLNIKYSLIGHSERRHVFKETDEDMNLKMQSCLKNNIIPVLCIGETKEERESNGTKEVLERQLNIALKDVSLTDIIIAYEPVWAIGTGLIPTMDEINDIHLHIKRVLKESLSINSKVLYGGSVNLSNISDITILGNVDGVLIGGASNDPNNLIAMYNKM